jgi:hypothetical protein
MSTAPESNLRSKIGIWTVLHYAVCACVIGLGFVGLIASTVDILFDLALRSKAWTVAGWSVVGVLFVGALFYRPASATMAGMGSLVIIAWFVWIAANIAVHRAF